MEEGYKADGSAAPLARPPRPAALYPWLDLTAAGGVRPGRLFLSGRRGMAGPG